MIEIPMQIKLTLDHMRAEIVHAFAGIDLAPQVDQAVKRAVEQFDFQREVQTIFSQEITARLRDGIRRELSALAWTDKQFRNELAAVVTAALKRTRE